MPHSAKAIVLHCMDYRFIHDLVHFMKEEGLDRQYDDVSAAGATKNIVDPYDHTDKEFILRQIELAKKLHGITTVYLINHRDCGGYGKIFNSPQEEFDRHVRDLKTAQQIIIERFEGLTVKTILAAVDEVGRASFEKIE